MADMRLNILCWEGYAPAEKVTQFEQMILKKYGEKLTLAVQYAAEDKQWFEMIRAKQADIISPAHNIPKSKTWPMIQHGLLLPLNLENIPNYQKINPQLILSDFVTHNQQTYAVPLLYGPYGLAYNNQKISQAPTSWNIFWDPEYQGKYTVSEVFYEVNIYITALALGYPIAQLGDYESFSKDKRFRIKLAQLAQHADRMWTEVDKVDDLKGLTIATSFGFSFTDLKNQGETWAFASPKEGQSAWVDHWAIGYSLKDSPLKKKIAEEWINFTLTEDLQLALARQLSSSPVLSHFEQPLDSNELQKYHLDDSNFFADQFFLLTALDRRQQNGFKKLWEQAKNAK